MKVKIFWKDNCPNCPKAKELGAELQKNNVDVELFNINEIEGLTEAVSLGVMSTPSVVIAKDDQELKSWRSEVPQMVEVKRVLDSVRK